MRGGGQVWPICVAGFDYTPCPGIGQIGRDPPMFSVLVVDDESALRAATMRFLTALGLDVEGAESAEAAELVLSERAYDLVITDLQMTGASGLDLAERMRVLRPSVPCILVSGALREEDVSRSRDLGVFRVLEKPYSFATLASAVQDALGYL